MATGAQPPAEATTPLPPEAWVRSSLPSALAFFAEAAEREAQARDASRVGMQGLQPDLGLPAAPPADGRGRRGRPGRRAPPVRLWRHADRGLDISDHRGLPGRCRGDGRWLPGAPAARGRLPVVRVRVARSPAGPTLTACRRRRPVLRPPVLRAAQLWRQGVGGAVFSRGHWCA